ncbi:MAG: hypothetical protein RBR71_13690 [Gudongella sp.]|nr:hypothetical protein [Gudongella sp.]
MLSWLYANGHVVLVTQAKPAFYRPTAVQPPLNGGIMELVASAHGVNVVISLLRYHARGHAR